MGIAEMNESADLDGLAAEGKPCPSEEMLVKALNRDSFACSGDFGSVTLD